jgi:hypothetical protein
MITKKVKRFKVRPDHWTPDMDCLMGKEISVFKLEDDGEYITPRLKPHKLVDDRMWHLAKTDFVKKKKLKKSISF